MVPQELESMLCIPLPPILYDQVSLHQQTALLKAKTCHLNWEPTPGLLAMSQKLSAVG